MRVPPYSSRIEPYLEAIAGCDAFFVAERDYGRIINYRQMGNDVFPTPSKAPDTHTAYLWGLRRQCRGLIFDLDGNVIGPGFEKFFNVNEREETLVENIDWAAPHVILDKLDGSMCRPVFFSQEGWTMCTKMGPTSVANNAERWARNHANYDRFFWDLHNHGLTPLLEWCSRQNPIVIDHPVDRLVLTAVRDNPTGGYLTYTQLQELAGEYGLDLVRQFEGSVESMQSLMDHTRDLQNAEGYVVRWLDGHMVKIKGEQYCQIHRAKEGILRENAVIEMILDEKLDDVKAFLLLDDRAALEEYESRFWQGVHVTAAEWQRVYTQVRARYGNDRKGFALAAGDMDAHVRSAVFKCWDQADLDWCEMVTDTVRRNLSTLIKTDAARGLWGNAVWDGSRMRVED